MFFSTLTCLHSLEVVKGLTKLDNVVCNRMRKYFIQLSIQYILLVYISISCKGENITGVSFAYLYCIVGNSLNANRNT